MKKIFTVLSIALGMLVNAQTIIYSENFGTTATSTTLITSFTGWQNGSPISYSGTADIRQTGVSTGYTGASGSDCVFFAATGGKTLIISGLNTSSANTNNLTLNFGFSSSQANKNLIVETSTDGNTWAPLVTASNTNTSWALKTVASGIPSSSTLSLRFTGLDTSSGGMRIDDVSIVNTASLGLENNKISTKKYIVENTVVENLLYLQGKVNSRVKIYSPDGKLVKFAIVNSGTSTIDVSSLPKGNYIVTGELNGERISQKILKK